MNIVKVKAIINVIITIIFFIICLVASNHTDTSEQNTTQEITVIPKQTEEPKAISDISTDIIMPKSKVIQDIISETTYDKFTNDEIHLIEVTVQHEVGNFSEDYQTLVAELIYNRLMSEQFPNTVEEVLYQEGQFCGIEDWYSSDIVVNDTTKDIVKSVFNKETTSHNALYYYNPELSADYAIEWFEYSGDVDYLFEYTEENWGIEYTTRFFK